MGQVSTLTTQLNCVDPQMIHKLQPMFMDGVDVGAWVT